MFKNSRACSVGVKKALETGLFSAGAKLDKLLYNIERRLPWKSCLIF